MIDYTTIPDWVRREIDEWAAIATWPGTFVEAVLRNDLADAFGKATEDEVRAMHSIVCYVYTHIPSAAWRTREKMVAWRAITEKEFARALAELLAKNGRLSEKHRDEIRRIRQALADQLIASQRQRSIGAQQSG